MACKRPIHELLSDSEGEDTKPAPTSGAFVPVEVKAVCEQKESFDEVPKAKKPQVGHTAWIDTLKIIYEPVFTALQQQTRALRLQTGCSGSGSPAICLQVLQQSMCKTKRLRQRVIDFGAKKGCAGLAHLHSSALSLGCGCDQ